ncbi:MAG: response regulator transcription factor [Saccharospirillum sp.]|nr:response regulator transcription factor [Saccharospirillum sp.]
MESILLVEDDTPTRQRLAEALQASGFAMVLAVGTCAAARAELQALPPRVLLVDLGLPDGSGLELIAETRENSPDTEIMVITVFGDERHVLAAIEAGASGYLLKDGSSDHIGRSVRQLLDGGSPISAPIARHLLKRMGQEPAQSARDEQLKLTPRETEVLNLVAKGFSYQEIATTLEMTVNTVASHVKQLYRKLSVHSRSEAVFEAVQRGLLTLR